SLLPGLVRSGARPGADERAARAALGLRLRDDRARRPVSAAARDALFGQRAARRDAHGVERAARRAPARRSRLAPDRARRPAAPRHEAAPDRRAARSGLDDGDGALFGRGPVVRAERLLELL